MRINHTHAKKWLIFTIKLKIVRIFTIEIPLKPLLGVAFRKMLTVYSTQESI